MKTPRQSVQPKRESRVQDAQGRLSDLVRFAGSNSPYHVTLDGRLVVMVQADEARRLQGAPNGQSLIEAMQASPHRATKIEPRRAAMPVRSVKL